MVGVQGGRPGEVVCVPGANDEKSWALHQLGGATVLGAVYDAIENYPDNVIVKQTLQS